MSKKQRPQRTAFDQPSTVEKVVHGAQKKLKEEARHDQRGVAGSSGTVGVDKAGVPKATYNVPLDVQERVNEFAGELDIPKNDLVGAAVIALYNAWKKDPDLLDKYVKPGRLLRYKNRLEVPDDFDIF